MAKKQVSFPISPAEPKAPPSPRSRREELLDALLEHTTNELHKRILKAYMASGTVDGAEQEFSKIIEEIVNEA
jgi:hypothetical protein